MFLTARLHVVRLSCLPVAVDVAPGPDDIDRPADDVANSIQLFLRTILCNMHIIYVRVTIQCIN